MEEIKGGSGNASPSSSPPTPPSSLPVSVGPGNQKYFFSPSPSTSPPFSPPHSSRMSGENLLLLQDKPSEKPVQVPSAFSMDRPEHDQLDSKSTCLKDLIEWFMQRCCNCCSTIR